MYISIFSVYYNYTSVFYDLFRSILNLHRHFKYVKKLSNEKFLDIRELGQNFLAYYKIFFFLSPSTPFSLLLLFSFWLYLLLPHFSPTSLHSSTLSFLSHSVSLHPFPLIYVVMIVVNTIHTFVLLRDGNLIFWWPSVIHV